MRNVLAIVAGFSLLCSVTSCKAKPPTDDNNSAVADSVSVRTIPETLNTVAVPQQPAPPAKTPKAAPKKDESDTVGTSDTNGSRILGRDSAIVAPKGGRRTLPFNNP